MITGPAITTLRTRLPIFGTALYGITSQWQTSILTHTTIVLGTNTVAIPLQTK